MFQYKITFALFPYHFPIFLRIKFNIRRKHALYDKSAARKISPPPSRKKKKILFS